MNCYRMIYIISLKFKVKNIVLIVTMIESKNVLLAYCMYLKTWSIEPHLSVITDAHLDSNIFPTLLG